MKYFKIEKFFRGGSHVYYAKMKTNLRMKINCWSQQLEEWGENTDSGKCYGYRICQKQIKQFPKKTKIDMWNTLTFDPENLK